MKTLLLKMWRDERGVLSFEWVLLLTLLTIGIVAGLTAARDAIIDELGDVAEAAVHIDQSFTLAPDPTFGTGGFGYSDSVPAVARDRRGTLSRQGSTPNCSVPSGG